MTKKESVITEAVNPLVAIERDVDQLVVKGCVALDGFLQLNQEQIDYIVAKASVARAILDFIEHGWPAAADEVPACATARGDRVVVAVMSPTDFQRVSDFAARRGLRRSAIGRVALAKRYANVDLPESLAAVTAGWPR